MCPHDRRRREPRLLSEANLKALALRLFIVFFCSEVLMSTPWFPINPIAIGLGMTNRQNLSSTPDVFEKF